MTKLTKEQNFERNPFMNALFQKNNVGGLPQVPNSPVKSYRWVRTSMGGHDDVANVSTVLNMDHRLKVSWVKPGEIPDLKAYENKSTGRVTFKDLSLVSFDKRMASYYNDAQHEKARMQSARLYEDIASQRNSKGESVFSIEDSERDAVSVDFD